MKLVLLGVFLLLGTVSSKSFAQIAPGQIKCIDPCIVISTTNPNIQGISAYTASLQWGSDGLVDGVVYSANGNIMRYTSLNQSITVNGYLYKKQVNYQNTCPRSNPNCHPQ